MDDGLESISDAHLDPAIEMTLAGLQSVEAREREIRRTLAVLNERVAEIERRGHLVGLACKRSEGLADLSAEVTRLAGIIKAMKLAHTPPHRGSDIRPIIQPLALLTVSCARAALAACQDTLKRDPELLAAIREEIEPLIDAVEQIAQSHAHVRPVDRFR